MSGYRLPMERTQIHLSEAERNGLQAMALRSGRSQGTGLADVLIAARVDPVKATLVTLNRRHVPMLVDVLVPYQSRAQAELWRTCSGITPSRMFCRKRDAYNA